MKNPSASMIVIGDEILSGRTCDTNVNYLARKLYKVGIILKEVRIVGDSKKSIILAVKDLSKSFDYVFTCGGIGPTHDDITAASVAKAFGLKYEVHQEAYKILESYYKPGEFNEGRQKMIWMPENAEFSTYFHKNW